MSVKPKLDASDELSPLDKARAIVQADRDARVDAFGKASAALQQEHRCEYVAVPGQAVVMPDGTTIVPPPTVGIRPLD